MSDELRSTTFKVLEPVMGYVEGEEPTIIDLDDEREAEYLADGSLEYVSGDKPKSVVEAEEAQAATDAQESAGESKVDYEVYTVDELKELSDQRGLDPEGSGSNGNVLKEDYIAALEADDQKGDE